VLADYYWYEGFVWEMILRGVERGWNWNWKRASREEALFFGAGYNSHCYYCWRPHARKSHHTFVLSMKMDTRMDRTFL